MLAVKMNKLFSESVTMSSKSNFNAATSQQPRRTFFGGRQGHRVILFG